jgi:hypothetical protein
MAVLKLCHRALPEGETLKAGSSIFEIILDEEYGKPASEPNAPVSEAKLEPVEETIEEPAVDVEPESAELEKEA